MSERSPNRNRKTLTRRQFLMGAGALTGSALVGNIPEPSPSKELKGRTAHTFSHNRDTLEDIENATGIYAIEMDVTLLETGELVLAHTPHDFLKLSPAARKLQDPLLAADAIRRVNSRVHTDIKLEDEAVEKIKDFTPFISFLTIQQDIAPLTVSSPNHKFLWELHHSSQEKFGGQILFTLNDKHAVRRFLNKYTPEHFTNGSFGVSINHEALTHDTGLKLKELGLYILAYTLDQPHVIVQAVDNKADGITSNRIRVLHQLEENKLAA